jgi:predicted translin family RNA/ssDNA-binding protein
VCTFASTTPGRSLLTPPTSARKLASPLPHHLIKEVTARHAEINQHLSGISADLQALNAHRYQRNISGGLQELIEALAFQHYILTGTLLSYSAAQSLIPGGIELSVADYILGIFDFVGEVMRFGITMIALGGAGEGGGGDAGRILNDLRRLREEFERLDTGGAAAGLLGKDVEKKMQVMKQCVEKVENAVYGVIVRGSEKPKGWVPDLEQQQQPQEQRFEDY